MGSRPCWSTKRSGWALAAIALPASLYVSTAAAQHADAGAEHHAAKPPKADEQKEQAERSGILKRIDPAVLSEGVRAGLQEQAANQHPSSLPSVAPESQEPGAGPLRGRLGNLPAPTARHRLNDEPLRRGEAHQRRVQAVETGEGITLLSNRIQRPEPRLASLVARQPSEPVEETELEPVAAVPIDESPRVTAMHSLRPGSAREAKSASSELGWLVWPFVLFVGTGAVLGTLWFRKKTE